MSLLCWFKSFFRKGEVSPPEVVNSSTEPVIHLEEVHIAPCCIDDATVIWKTSDPAAPEILTPAQDLTIAEFIKEENKKVIVTQPKTKAPVPQGRKKTVKKKKKYKKK